MKTIDRYVSASFLFSYVVVLVGLLGLAIVIDALAMAAASAVLAFVYWMVAGAGGEYLPILSNLLFFEGGIVLTFGALIEFFHLRGTKVIHKVLMYPIKLFGSLNVTLTADKEKSEEQEAGWAMILLGAVLIFFSLVVSPDYII